MSWNIVSGFSKAPDKKEQTSGEMSCVKTSTRSFHFIATRESGALQTRGITTKKKTTKAKTKIPSVDQTGN